MTPLHLEPFRALTYAPDHNLADVTCPPYDTIAASAVRQYETAHPHNIVRLILPRSGSSEDRYAHAATELRTWIDEGALIADAEPSLYVYSQVTPLGSAIGLVGGVGLDGPVLPHENTFPDPVADRVAIMSATRAQLEPILLTYNGGGPASDVVDNVTASPPDIEVTVTSGQSHHRIWRVSDPARLQAINDDLAHRQALIADGHHRFAAYQQMHEAQRPGSDGFGLAMLVDSTRHPLSLRGMHRSVVSLPFTTAVDQAKAGFDITPVTDDPRGALTAAGPGPAFLIGDGTQWVLLTTPDEALLEAALPSQQSSRWRSLDAAVLRHTLLDHLWGIDDAHERVGYHSDLDTAVARAQSGDGVAVIVRAPQLEDVLSLATQGERMPQKATSFGPKPLTGLLMRLLH